MTFRLKPAVLPGTTSPKVRAYEREHRKTARKAAADGMVLLKNEGGLLPLPEGSAVALYGAGAVMTVKGGTGSGDVNAREVISIRQGLETAGYRITSESWLEEYRKIYEKARLDWRESVWKKMEEEHPENPDDGFFEAYTSMPFQTPAGSLPEKAEAETAFLVISRNAGEGKDRHNVPGDYELTTEEEHMLGRIALLYEHVVVVINAGGLMDLSFLDRYDRVHGLIYIQQPGMEAGNAFADLVSGRVSPSGKLTDSWAYHYADYPNAADFSHNNGNVDKEYYTEGIYVGYRYFDTFDVPVRYGFGYGLSYTACRLECLALQKEEAAPQREAGAAFRIRVTNTGTMPGREVVQVYASCPQAQQPKEYRRLAGFEKTKLLQPGEEQELCIRVPFYALCSYQENTGWILEQGIYGFFIGTSLQQAVFAGSLQTDEELLAVRTETICPCREKLEELQAPADLILKKRAGWEKKIPAFPVITLDRQEMPEQIISYGAEKSRIPEEVLKFTESLTEEQLIRLATGELGWGLESSLGSAGTSVPGSAAQTSGCALSAGLADIVLADGPAGLRLNQTYQTENGNILPAPPEMGMEGGFFCREDVRVRGETHYQFTTAIPAGTLLAQTWDPEVLEECGRAVAEEMREFGVTLWLAPGMNIHRNPLCGRNFEYYSEDPLLSGKMAAAVTRGVQSLPGCGTTIKHFACNNQEDNRLQSDSIVSERALREIYLKGFEIAVKQAQPEAVMTSYNLVNGVHAANCGDLCTRAARDEWGFRGLIMTDWTTTNHGPDCTAGGCIRAGNDLVMPGIREDHQNIRAELEQGTLDIRDLKKSVARLVSLIWRSDRYE